MLLSTKKIKNNREFNALFSLNNSREHDGAISKILVYLCVDIGSTLGLYVQFEFSIQFRALAVEEVQGHSMHPSTDLYG